MKRHIAYLLVVTAGLTIAVAPALAGKGGNGGGGSGGSGTTSSSISLATVNGTSAASTQPKLGDTLTFATTVGSLSGWQYPMVAVTCYQGSELVFSDLDQPSASFTLGGYSSLWTLNGGGPATCRADLDAYGWKGGVESVQVLASTGDWAASG